MIMMFYRINWYEILKKVMHWFEENDMKINPDKFQYIVFGKDESIKDIKIGNVNI